jgi:hypothetical protein
MTNLEQVRLIIGDLDSANLLFTDLQITEFLTLKGNSVLLASALALRSIANNLARKQTLTIGSYSKSSAVSELNKQADKLEADAEAAGLDANGNAVFYMGYVEQIHTEFNAEEIIKNVAIRKDL